MNYETRHGRRIEVVELDTGHQPKRRRKQFEPSFVKVPRHWITALRRSRSASTYELAHLILWEAFKRNYVGGDIVLSAEVTDMPSRTKRRAAMELVELGLIKTVHKGKQAIRVLLL